MAAASDGFSMAAASDGFSMAACCFKVVQHRVR
jgi:hypothetical protein